MKRLIKSSWSSDVLNLNIDLFYSLSSSGTEVAATTIKPVGIDRVTDQIDEEAKEGYTIFVGNVFEILTAYDFEIFDEFKKTSKSFPYTSEYRWIARKEEIESNDIPQLIKLRISDHVQKFSKEREAELAKQLRQEAEILKMPKTKKKQRYKLEEIVVCELGCKTYEEALHIVEEKVREWLVAKGVDLEPYGPAIW